MSNPTLPTAPTSEEQITLDAEVAAVLGLANPVHVDTVRARNISFAEVAAAMKASADEPFEFDGYLADEVGLLQARRFRVHRSRRRNEPFEPLFAPIPNPRAGGPDMVADRDHVVGFAVKFVVVNPDGTSGSDVLLYTSPEAEDSAKILTGRSRVGDDARRVYLADPAAPFQPLMPMYGSQATVSFIVADLPPDEVAERTRRALEAEFGGALGKNRKIRTRQIANRRVDVFRVDDNTPVAVGILVDEVSLAMESAKTGAVRTESHRPTKGVIVGS